MFLLFLQHVFKLHRIHVVEQDVFSCFICHGCGCVYFFIAVLRLLTFSDPVLAFQQFTSVISACRLRDWRCV